MRRRSGSGTRTGDLSSPKLSLERLPRHIIYTPIRYDKKNQGLCLGIREQKHQPHCQDAGTWQGTHPIGGGHPIEINVFIGFEAQRIPEIWRASILPENHMSVASKTALPSSFLYRAKIIVTFEDEEALWPANFAWADYIRLYIVSILPRQTFADT